jgi:hypothetical protein
VSSAGGDRADESRRRSESAPDWRRAVHDLVQGIRCRAGSGGVACSGHAQEDPEDPTRTLRASGLQRLRGWRPQGRGGSNPPFRTNLRQTLATPVASVGRPRHSTFRRRLSAVALRGTSSNRRRAKAGPRDEAGLPAQRAPSGKPTFRRRLSAVASERSDRSRRRWTPPTDIRLARSWRRRQPTPHSWRSQFGIRVGGSRKRAWPRRTDAALETTPATRTVLSDEVYCPQNLPIKRCRGTPRVPLPPTRAPPAQFAGPPRTGQRLAHGLRAVTSSSPWRRTRPRGRLGGLPTSGARRA